MRPAQTIRIQNEPPLSTRTPTAGRRRANPARIADEHVVWNAHIAYELRVSAHGKQERVLSAHHRTDDEFGFHTARIPGLRFEYGQFVTGALTSRLREIRAGDHVFERAFPTR